MNKAQEIKEVIANFIMKVCSKERYIEIRRQLLCDKNDFEPYVAFNRLARSNDSSGITTHNITNFLGDSMIVVDEICTKALLHHYDSDADDVLSYKEFLDIVLPKEHPDLRAFVTQRECFEITNDEYLSYETEAALAVLIDREINLFEDVLEAKDKLDKNGLSGYKIVEIIHGSGNGSLTFKNLRKFIHESGIMPYDSEIISFLRRVDRDDDGVITADELEKFLSLFTFAKKSIRYNSSRRNPPQKRDLKTKSPKRKIVNNKVSLLSSKKMPSILSNTYDDDKGTAKRSGSTNGKSGPSGGTSGFRSGVGSVQKDRGNHRESLVATMGAPDTENYDFQDRRRSSIQLTRELEEIKKWTSKAKRDRNARKEVISELEFSMKKENESNLNNHSSNTYKVSGGGARIHNYSTLAATCSNTSQIHAGGERMSFQNQRISHKHYSGKTPSSKIKRNSHHQSRHSTLYDSKMDEYGGSPSLINTKAAELVGRANYPETSMLGFSSHKSRQEEAPKGSQTAKMNGGDRRRDSFGYSSNMHQRGAGGYQSSYGSEQRPSLSRSKPHGGSGVNKEPRNSLSGVGDTGPKNTGLYRRSSVGRDEHGKQMPRHHQQGSVSKNSNSRSPIQIRSTNGKLAPRRSVKSSNKIGVLSGSVEKRSNPYNSTSKKPNTPTHKYHDFNSRRPPGAPLSKTGSLSATVGAGDGASKPPQNYRRESFGGRSSLPIKDDPINRSYQKDRRESGVHKKEPQGANLPPKTYERHGKCVLPNFCSEAI